MTSAVRFFDDLPNAIFLNVYFEFFTFMHLNNASLWFSRFSPSDVHKP